jgi:hypothetical protein
MARYRDTHGYGAWWDHIMKRRNPERENLSEFEEVLVRLERIEVALSAIKHALFTVDHRHPSSRMLEMDGSWLKDGNSKKFGTKVFFWFAGCLYVGKLLVDKAKHIGS